MRLLVCLLLCALPAVSDTLWTLTGARTNWEGKTPVLDLIVPVGANGEATNVTSWSSQPDPEFGDITDYLGIYWPHMPGTPAGPAAPYGPPQELFADDEASDFQPSGLRFSLIEMDGLNTDELEGIYYVADYGDTPTGPYGPFTVADPPFPSVPEPAAWALALAGLALLVFRPRRTA